MSGVKSEAMLLAASNGDKVEPLDPPAGSKPGEKVTVEGFNTEDPDQMLNPKKKIFEHIQPELKINTKSVATYKGIPLMTAGGDVTVKTLVDANIR